MSTFSTKRHHTGTLRPLILVLICLGMVPAGLYASYAQLSRTSIPVSAATVSFELYATHPNASKAGYDETSENYYTGQKLCTGGGVAIMRSSSDVFCPTGHTLTSMAISDDGQLVAGYGDWDSNLDSFGVEEGRVGVVPLDLSTGEWGDMFYAGSEAIDNIRTIDGKLYVPTIDPSDRAASTNPHGNISGYMTNEDGSWRFVDDGTPQDTHTFDVAKRTDNEIWTVGGNGTGSFARKSTDGGATWQVGLQNSDGGWGRFYWAAAIKEKLYVQSAERSVAQVYDGSTWSEVASLGCGNDYHRTFKDQLVCTNRTIFRVFDGTTAKEVPVNSTRPYIFASYATGDYFYALTETGVWRTDSFANSWQRVSTGNYPASGVVSMAVYDDYIYLGGPYGQIYRSTTTITEALSQGDPLDKCFIVENGSVVDYTETDRDCSASVVIPEEIDGTPTTSIAADAFRSSGVETVSIPSSVTRIEASAFEDNTITSIELPESISFIGNRAFYGNALSDVVVPQAVTFIGTEAFRNNELHTVTLGGSPSLGANVFLPKDSTTARDNFVHVYAPAGTSLKNTLYRRTAVSPVLGGHIINPATVTLRMINSSGTALRSTTQKTGEFFEDYSVASFVKRYPEASTAIFNQAYYQRGQTATITPPAIASYIRPSAKEITLNDNGASVVFIYTTSASTIPPSTIGQSTDKQPPISGVVQAPGAVRTLSTPPSSTHHSVDSQPSDNRPAETGHSTPALREESTIASSQQNDTEDTTTAADADSSVWLSATIASVAAVALIIVTAWFFVRKSA